MNSHKLTKHHSINYETLIILLLFELTLLNSLQLNIKLKLFFRKHVIHFLFDNFKFTIASK